LSGDKFLTKQKMRLFRRAGLVIDWNSQMVEVAGNAVVCARLFLFAIHSDAGCHSFALACEKKAQQI